VALPNTIHKPFEDKAKTTDYSIIWARLADKALTKIAILLPPKRKFVALGNAAGGLTALVLTIMRDDVLALSTNGAFFSLEHTRREYRIFTHPFCHDFRAFFSYTPVYALIVPKPLQIQMGKKDSLGLGGTAVPKSSWFSGMKRGAIADETLGSFLMLKEIGKKFGVFVEYDNHPGGHEDVDVDAFIAFVKKNRL
jgi:hypothetical protein